MRLATILAITLLACGCGRVRAYQARATEKCEMVRYRIQWRSTVTGKRGHGEWTLDPNLAFKWANDGNRDFPEIKHWIEAHGHTYDECQPVLYPSCESGNFGGQECR